MISLSFKVNVLLYACIFSAKIYSVIFPCDLCVFAYSQPHCSQITKEPTFLIKFLLLSPKKERLKCFVNRSTELTP